MSTAPTGLLCVIPSRLRVGEPFGVKVKVLGEIRQVPAYCWWDTPKPNTRSPFNKCVERGTQYLDNCPPEWTGSLRIVTRDALTGPEAIEFDGTNQGVFPRDRRPIRTLPGFTWTTPGFHFLEVEDPVSGQRWPSNPAYVTHEAPTRRLVWGDIHWHTIFSDAIRAPEELYAFARDEAFLDFGALSDHVEAITDLQWDYYTAVANHYNAPGSFATLVAQEWTNMQLGHRNIYFPGDRGPVLRSTDPRYQTLEGMWKALDGVEALVIPHHSANTTMGVDWSLGWNPRLERAVEIHSVWGNSERSAEDGNPLPIRPMKGEKRGQHVVDALRRGYRLTFVGGGDIHDGRPGDDLHIHQPVAQYDTLRQQGFTGAWVPDLSRASVYDAMKHGTTYATVRSRIYLEATPAAGRAHALAVRAASEDTLASATLVRNGRDEAHLTPGGDARVIEGTLAVDDPAPGDFYYVRVATKRDRLAWSSPRWVEA